MMTATPPPAFNPPLTPEQIAENEAMTRLANSAASQRQRSEFGRYTALDQQRPFRPMTLEDQVRSLAQAPRLYNSNKHADVQSGASSAPLDGEERL